MATLVLGGIGASIGASFGDPALGYAIGSTLGSALFPPKLPGLEKGRLADLKVQNASYGSAIPILYGRARIAGTILWTTGVRETIRTDSGGGGKGGAEQSTTEYSYDMSIAILICEGPIERVNRIWANSEVIYDYNNDSPQKGYELTENADMWSGATLRVYKGTETQVQDSVVQAYVDAEHGAGSTPAYRGRCYVVFEDFPLAKFGNHLPNFTFEVYQEDADTVSLSDVLVSLVEKVGIAEADTDFSATDAVEVRGLPIPARGAVRGVIEALMGAYHFDLIEADGKVMSVLRNTGSAVPIPADDMGATESGEVLRLTVTRAQEVELPRMVDVVYIDTANDYQQGTQRAIRQVADSEELKSLNLPLVLTSDEARQIAEVSLYESWVRREGYSLRLPWRYLYLTPGDILTLPDVAGEDRTMRIESITAGMPGVLEVSGNAYDPEVYAQVVSGAAPPTPPPNPIGIVETTFKAFSCPQLRNEDGVAPGFYVGATGPNGWQGCTVFYSPDAGATYIQVGFIRGRSVIGETAMSTTLEEWFTPETWDATNAVDIDLLVTGTLSTVTETEVLAGINIAVIGDEMLGFTDADLQSPLNYELTNFYRGMRGSDMGPHAGGSRFVLLSEHLFHAFVPENLIGENIKVKCVSPGQDIDDVTEDNVEVCAPGKPFLETPIGTPVAGSVPEYDPVSGGTVWSTGLHKFVFANATDRAAGTGYTILPADVGKLAWQQDDDTLWGLADDSPITWEAVGGSVKSVATAGGLTGGPITNTGTISIDTNGVTTAKIADANVTTAKIADANVTVAKLLATGSPGNTTFLRGDGAWAAPGTAAAFQTAWFPAIVPPPSSGWSWLNQGSNATLNSGTGYEGIEVPAEGIGNLTGMRARARTYPTAPFTLTMACYFFNSASAFAAFGFLIRDSAAAAPASKFIGWVCYGVNDFRLSTQNYDAALTGTSGGTTTLWNMNSISFAGAGIGPLFWMRYRDDNTDRFLDLSADGIIWENLMQEARTTSFTPDEIGFSCKSPNAATGNMNKTALTIVHWDVV